MTKIFYERCDNCGKEISIEGGTALMDTKDGAVYCIECFEERGGVE